MCLAVSLAFTWVALAGAPTLALFLPLLPLLPSLWIASLCLNCLTWITPNFSGNCGMEVLWARITWIFYP